MRSSDSRAQGGSADARCLMEPSTKGKRPVDIVFVDYLNIQHSRTP